MFVKDGANLEMLKRSLESKEIDVDIIPILEKFFSLPITPRESCYGHMETGKEPYLSYVDDEALNEDDLAIQKRFKENVIQLQTKINARIDREAINIILEEIDHKKGPKDYTLQFEIIDKEIFQKNGKELLEIIWDEFSKYISELN